MRVPDELVFANVAFLLFQSGAITLLDLASSSADMFAVLSVDVVFPCDLFSANETRRFRKCLSRSYRSSTSISRLRDARFCASSFTRSNIRREDIRKISLVERLSKNCRIIRNLAWCWINRISKTDLARFCVSTERSRGFCVSRVSSESTSTFRATSPRAE